MSESISRLLQEHFGVAARPGKKATCPECGKANLGVHPDDQLAKCFTATCGWYLHSYSFSQEITPRGSGLEKYLEYVFKDFHQELVDLSNRSIPAYRYLVEERGIHPEVIQAARLGVVPNGYDVNTHLGTAVIDLKRKIWDLDQEREGKKGRPARSYTEKREKLEKCIEGLEEKIQDLQRQLDCYAGWICFFHSDANHRITLLRFRKPYSKVIRTWKLGERNGVFGHEVFSPKADRSRELGDKLFVCEGEVNTLQLQSLMARCRDVIGGRYEFVHSCAVGGASGADLETIRRICRTPIIFPDNDGSGATVVTRAQELMTVEVARVPDPYSDLDEYICSFGEDAMRATEAVREILACRTPRFRLFEPVKVRVEDVRATNGNELPAFKKAREVLRVITEDLEDRGQFYHDGTTPYVFCREDKVLYPLGIDEHDLGLLLHRYGLNRSEELYKFVVEGLKAIAFSEGQAIEAHCLHFYDKAKGLLYLSNHAGQVYRISAESVDLVDNGTDGVLFLKTPGAEPFQVLDEMGPGDHLDRIILGSPNLSDDGKVTPDERRFLMKAWLLSTFFRTIMPTKPILAFVGVKGSGKSITPKKMGMMLIGGGFGVMQLSSDSKDFDAAVTNSPFVAVDNADDPCSWLCDRLATVATGASLTKRELYTTNRMVEYPVRAALAITSRTPHFRRDDVADRLLLMPVERFDDFRPEGEFLSEVAECRNELMTELILELQKVVAALNDQAAFRYQGFFRMADFAAFVTKLVRSDSDQDEEWVTGLFRRLQEEQAAFTVADDPLVELLIDWAWEKPEGAFKANSALCSELTKLEASRGNRFFYEGNVRGFAAKMNQIKPALDQIFEPITMKTGHARSRLYWYRLQDEYRKRVEAEEEKPQLEIVRRSA